jgi:diacylglycerol kinase family enzyme
MRRPCRKRLLELDAAQHENDALYARWAELTEKAGIIPLGSANALARHLRLSLDPMTAALEQIRRRAAD